MIKKTLYFGNPAYLSLQNGQLVLRLPEVEKNDSIPTAWKQRAERTIPVEDIGVVLLDHRHITITRPCSPPCSTTTAPSLPATTATCPPASCSHCAAMPHRANASAPR